MQKLQRLQRKQRKQKLLINQKENTKNKVFNV
jgi:hypothetical protein